jgi:Amt family ammonium transporter
VIAKLMRFRITEEDEVAGIDGVVHAETGYDLASLGGGGGSGLSASGQSRAEARGSDLTDRSRV